MAIIPQEELDALRSQADIVSVIHHYIPVSKIGKSFKAVCPFHDDHDPSLSINPDKKIFKCFVCGAGGNVFTFVERYENVSFVEAVNQVAKLTNFQLSTPITSVAPKIDPEKQKLYQVLNETIEFSMYQLKTKEAIKYKEYLEKRGLDERIREIFQIGYIPKNDVLYKFLQAKGYQEKDMSDANVIHFTASGLHDVFYDRITFPLHDEYGNPIGFSARSIDPNNPSKYINTNDSKLFTKSNVVYNYHRAKASARKNGFVFVCEGVTDVIAFAKAGIENCVCTLGTSCTNNQIKALKNLAPMIVFCYDGDQAGQKATYRAGKMASEVGCQVMVVDNQTKLDPDEIIRQLGKDVFLQTIDHRMHWIDFVMQFLQNEKNLDNFYEKKEYITEVSQEIARLNQEFDRNYFNEKLSKIVGIPIESGVTKKQKETPVRSVRMIDGLEKAQCLVLAQLIAHPKLMQVYLQHQGFLSGDLYQELALFLVDEYRKQVYDPLTLIDHASNNQLKELITNLITSTEYQYEYNEQLFIGALRKVKIESLHQASKQIQQALLQEVNPEKKKELMVQYMSCLNEYRRYIDEENK